MRGNHGPAICYPARVRLHSPRLRWRHDPVGHRQGLQNIDSGEPDQRAHKLKQVDSSAVNWSIFLTKCAWSLAANGAISASRCSSTVSGVLGNA